MVEYHRIALLSGLPRTNTSSPLLRLLLRKGHHYPSSLFLVTPHPYTHPASLCIPGITLVHNQCQEERLRKGHKYLGNYPCERIKKKSDVKTTQSSKSKVEMNQGNKPARKQGGKQSLDSSKKRQLLTSLITNSTFMGDQQDERNEREEIEESVENPPGEEDGEEVEKGFDADGKKIVMMGDPATFTSPSLRMMMTGLWSLEPT